MITEAWSRARCTLFQKTDWQELNSLFLTGIIFRQINVLIELFREGCINEDYMKQPNGNSTLYTANVLLTAIYDMWLNAKLVHFSSIFFAIWVAFSRWFLRL